MGSATDTLGQLVRDLCEMRAELRSNGADARAVELATERVVRQRFPSVREWKYLCQQCQDYGLETAECPGDRTCGRDKPHLPHAFGRPCWCSAGARFKKREADPEVDFQQAGKVQRKPSRFGR